MTTLFKRQWRVSVGTDEESLVTSSLRVTFNITKTLEKEPNKAEVQITNLADASRKRLQKKFMPVVVQAGYAESIGTLFSGDSRIVEHTREGADWNTKLHCGDGERAYNYARVNESFGPNTTVETVLRTVAASLSLNPGNLSDVLSQPGKVQVFKHGFVAFGPASQVLDKAARAAGLLWSVQQGALQFHFPGQPIQTRAFRLSAASGLLGSPERSAPEKKNHQTIVKCRSLLNHQLVPGYVVILDAEDVKGEFIMQKVTHTGDSHGSDWFSDLECVARKNV